MDESELFTLLAFAYTYEDDTWPTRTWPLYSELYLTSDEQDEVNTAIRCFINRSASCVNSVNFLVIACLLSA